MMVLEQDGVAIFSRIKCWCPKEKIKGNLKFIHFGWEGFRGVSLMRGGFQLDR